MAADSPLRMVNDGWLVDSAYDIIRCHQLTNDGELYWLVADSGEFMAW